MYIKPRVAIIGVTGFIGKGLPEILVMAGYSVTGISRSGKGNVSSIDRWQSFDDIDLGGYDAIINLAGERIDRRWNAANREKFHDSRVGVTNRLIDHIQSLPIEARPKVLINGSAVGIYGDRGDEPIDESSTLGNDYLSMLCRDWETSAMRAENLGLRVVRLRIGIVLGRGGAAFEKLLMVFKLGIGGKLGSGEQWMPWIHIEDLRSAIVHSIASDSLSGAINCSTPHPEKNFSFTRKFAISLSRPAFFSVPSFALKVVLGGFGGVLLAGQRALPNALLSDGFQFRFSTLETALADLLNK